MGGGMKRLFGSLLVLALAGCTMAKTTMIADNQAMILAEDLSTGSPKAVRKKALAAAAEAASARGFDYFGILAVRDASTRSDVHFSGPMPSPSCGGRVCSATSSGIFVPTRWLALEVTVRFLHPNELPEDMDGIYQASAILAART
jgi:hypothetical protein